MKATLDLAFNYPQWQAYRAIQPRRTVFYGWGRGVGKSWFTRCNWWLKVAEYDGKQRDAALKPFRGVRIIVLMPTLVQFKDVHWAGIEQEVGPGGEWAFLRARLDRQRGHITFPGGSWIKPFPASAYNARTARGMRGDILSCDEFDDIDSVVYDGVAIPMLSEPWSLGIELLGGTPTRGRHGLWYRALCAGRLGAKLRSGELTREEALRLSETQAIADVIRSIPAAERPLDADGNPSEPEDFAINALASNFAFHATYRDAPETVSALAVARARAKSPPATFKREWEADPDAGEGLVYPFDEDFHVKEPPPLSVFQEFHVGMDHGSTDAGVLLLCGIQGHGNDATLWVLDEIYESNCPNHVWDARAKNWSFAKFWPDSSRPDRLQDLRSLSLDVGEVDRGPGSILAGIARVADLMFIRSRQIGPGDRDVHSYSRLYVSPKCKHTIEEFGKYRYPKLPDGTFGEKPMDRWNHCIARGTLVAAERGDVPIELVVPGDRVMTRNGWREVHQAGLADRNRALWEITAANGHRVLGTPDHKVWTDNRGWIPMSEVAPGDVLVCLGNTADQYSAHTMVSAFGGTQSQRSSTFGSTGGPGRGDTYTASNGRPRSGPFQTASTSTTETATQPTTLSLTLSAFQGSSTFLNTAKTLAQIEPSGGLSTLNASGRWPKNGMRQPTAESGMLAMVGLYGPRFPLEPSLAGNAGSGSRLDVYRPRDFAGSTVKRSGAGTQGWMTSTGNARSAEVASGSTGTRQREPVLSTVRASRSAHRSADVFDLAVDRDHEFFAGGILVHNCLDSLKYVALGRFGRMTSGRYVAGGR